MEKMTEEIKGFLATILAVPKEQITGDKRLIEDYGLDSLDGLEFIGFLEDHYGVSISDEEFSQLQTLADSVQLIKEKLKVTL